MFIDYLNFTLIKNFCHCNVVEFAKQSEAVIRATVGNFYNQNRDLGKSYVVSHFQKMGLKPRRVYYIMKNIDERGYMLRKKGSGRKPTKMTEAKKQKLKNLMNKKKVVSQTKLAQKFNTNQSYISKTIKKLKINYYKREKVPLCTLKQKKKQTSRCSALRKGLFKPSTPIDIVMDDESYFGLSDEALPGNTGFYTDNKDDTPDDVKYRGKAKYATKVLVWAVISARGVSDLHVEECRTVSGPVYLEILRKHLQKFINAHYNSSNDIVFWPDLASAHYSEIVTDWLKEQNIPFVPKIQNPPNTPQLRPIENFWAILKQRVYQGGWKAKNKQDLIRRIKATAKKLDSNVFQKLFKGLKTKVRKASEGALKSISE